MPTTRKTHTPLQSDQAYHLLRQQILTFDLVPGQKISETKLTADLPYGRTPIREAILQLKSEGLLTVVPQSGTYIAKVDLQVAEQARYAREQIEPQIMRDALTRLTPADLDWLDNLLVEQATDANETATFFARDEAFHQFFYERTGHELLWRWLKDLSKQLDRFRWLRVASQRLDWQALIAEHQAILTALRHDDADTAYRIAYTHLQHMIADQLAVIASYPDYF